jgi:tetratricopeptide (TPR) repeat protein
MYINKAHEEGMIFLKEGKLDQALELLTTALIENPNHPDILSDRGVVYIHLNRKDDALQAFDSSLNLQPDYAYRYSSRAYARAFFGDIDAAILDYEKAVELDKDDAIAYNNLGLLLEQKGRMVQAKKNFDRADHLAKIEKELLNVVDELEVEGVNEQVQHERKQIEPIEKRNKELSTWNEMKKIFTSKEQFQDFLRFIKNGFKNK